MTESQGRAPENRAWLWPLALAGLLLAIAAARILQLQKVTPHFDEMWTLYQITGTWIEVIRWTPYDWPPLYYLALNAWMELVGAEPMALRMLSVFCFLIGASCFYRILNERAGTSAALIGTLIYGRMAYIIYISIELRGYSLMLGLILFAWLVAEKMLQRARWGYAICFAILVSAALNTSYISIFPVAFLFLYILLMANNRAWHIARYWALAWFIILLSLLPLVLYLLPLAYSRSEYTQTLAMLPMPEAIADWYRQIIGRGAGLIFMMILMGIGTLFWQRKLSRLQAFLLFWGVIMLPILYLLHPVLGFFSTKYSNWVSIGIAGFIAVTVATMPRWPVRMGIGVSSLLFLLPVDLPDNFSFYGPSHQLYRNFAWLSEEMRADDYVLLAEDHECIMKARYWNHPLQLYLPQGLHFVDFAVGHRRVWFVTADGSPNSVHWETLRRDYVERQFAGLPACLFRLYEGPPDREGVLFANGLRFHGAQLLVDGEALAPGLLPQVREGETFRVRLWWTVDERLPQDYSVGSFFFNRLSSEGGSVLFEKHGPPLPAYPSDAPWETSRWQPGQLYYEDREFQIPYPLTRQMLELRLAVYYWEGPAQRFTAPGTDALGMLPVMRIHVNSW